MKKQVTGIVLTSTIEKDAPALKIASKRPIKLWRVFISRFSRKPDKKAFMEKRRKIRDFVSQKLLKARGGKQWKIARITWTLIDEKHFVYRVKVFIKRKRPIPPGETDRTPTPAPPKPPSM